MDRGVWQATVHGVAQSWTRLSDQHFHFVSWAAYVGYTRWSAGAREENIRIYTCVYFKMRWALSCIQYLLCGWTPEATLSHVSRAVSMGVPVWGTETLGQLLAISILPWTTVSLLQEVTNRIHLTELRSLSGRIFTLLLKFATYISNFFSKHLLTNGSIKKAKIGSQSCIHFPTTFHVGIYSFSVGPLLDRNLVV